MCYGIHSLHIRARVCFVKWEEEVKILQWRYEKENFLVVCSMMDHHILLFATNTGSHEHSFRTILGLFRWQVLSITVDHCSAPNFRQYLTGLREIFHLQFFINSFVLPVDMISKSVKWQNYFCQIVTKRCHTTFNAIENTSPRCICSQKKCI